MKRIAMISYHTCPLASEEGKETGGMNVYVLELSKALTQIGLKVDIYTRSQHRTNRKIVDICTNLRLIHLKSGPQKSVNKKDLLTYIPEFVDNYQKFVTENNLEYDIIHTHYYLSGIISLQIKKTSKTNSPIIISFHTLALMKNLAARDLYEKEEIERIDAENMLTKNIDKIIAPTITESEYLQYLYNTKKDKISVISPGVNIKLFKPIDKNKAKNIIHAKTQEKIVLFVGRIEPLKGLDTLLYALKIFETKNPGLKLSLWIVGGDVSQKRQSWSYQLKTLDRLKNMLKITMPIKFIGQQHQHRLPFYYNASEVVIMPSHYESFGIVALEAMACGIPVITTNVSGVSSLIDRQHKSLITTVNNPLLLASQIEYLLTNDQIHDKLSADLLKKVQELNWQNIVKKVINIYENCLNEKKSLSLPARPSHQK